MGVGHIAVSPQDRSREIQYRVKETGETSVSDLDNYLKCRTRPDGSNKAATEPEKIADLYVAIAYLQVEGREASPFSPLFDKLARQILLLVKPNAKTLAQDAVTSAKISADDAVTLTELIYRAVYHTELLRYNQNVNEVNQQRGAKLAQPVAQHTAFGKFSEIFLSILCREYIPTDAEIRSAGIQEHVRRSGRNAVDELSHYLKYRTNTADAQQIKATDEEKIADLSAAKRYLLVCLPSAHASLLHSLYQQVNAAKISPQNAPAVTELIYRAAYHVECLGKDETPNPINAKRGAKLAKRISQDPNLKFFGGSCTFLFSLGLTVVGVVSLVGTLGLSAPISGTFIGVGLFGMYSAKPAYQGRKERAANYHKIGATKPIGKEPAVQSLVKFFQPMRQSESSMVVTDSSRSKPPKDSKSESETYEGNHRGDSDAHRVSVSLNNLNSPRMNDSLVASPVEPVVNQNSVVEENSAEISPQPSPSVSEQAGQNEYIKLVGDKYPFNLRPCVFAAPVQNRAPKDSVMAEYEAYLRNNNPSF